jgi:L-fucose isomerase-like protein
MLEKGIRLYHAMRAIIRANGYTSMSVRCWPENTEPFFGVSACLAMSLLLGRGEVTAAACEGDWPTAVVQTIGTLLSGQPAVCLDWVNHTGGSEIVQLGHCGMGVCGKMAAGGPPGKGPRDAIGLHPVLRQAGRTMGPVHLGQLEFGPKTGLCLAEDGGRFRILSFVGESGPDTARDMLYCATDVRVKDPRRLDRLVLEGGFPHHLAVAFGDISREVEMLCRLLGVDLVTPEGGRDGS